jgi:quinol monooxygenase YgiN
VILVTGHVRLAPESMDRIRPHMRKVLEATRKEPGCLLYAYGEDVLDPGLVRIVERWRDWPSLEAHDRAPHIEAWRAALKEIGVIDREVIAHEGGEERIL